MSESNETKTRLKHNTQHPPHMQQRYPIIKHICHKQYNHATFNTHDRSQDAQKGTTTMKKKECCETPHPIGYPIEHPVVYICMTCGKWNPKNT